MTNPKSMFYNGINNVRKDGIDIPLTEEQVIEIVKCKKDPEYFIETYIKIISKADDRFKKPVIRKKIDKNNIITKVKKKKNKATIAFILRDFQKDVLNNFIKFNRLIIKFPRQSGKSTIIQAIAAYLAIFNKNEAIAVLANKESSAKSFLAKIKIMIKNLPIWMQQGVVSWNKKSIELENGSSIVSAATSPDGIRGDSVGTCILDEVGFVPTNVWSEFYSSIYPTLAADEDSKLVLISTPNGMNHFYKFWKDAESGLSQFIPMEIKWNDIPGRDDAWRDATIKDVGMRMWRQEYLCEFLGSGGSLISSEGLNSMGISQPIEVRDEGHFRIFKLPEEDHIYMLVTDTGEGVGADASTIQVIDVTEHYVREQVSVYESNVISTNDFPAVVERIAQMYNGGCVIGENNTIGNDVLNDLVYDYEYENVFFSSEVDKKRFGLRMTGPSKRIGNSYLKRHIEDGNLILHDEKTIFQFSVYVKKGETYKADGDEHDDLVTPFVHHSYFMRRDDWFEEWFDVNVDSEERKRNLQSKIDDEIIPAGWVNRGTGTIDLNDNNSYYGGKSSGGSFNDMSDMY